MRIYKGEGSPSRYTGSTGDFFVNVKSWELFGPKERAGWGRGRRIWPDGVPRVVPNPADDKPLAVASGATLVTGSGRPVKGDLRD